jgi:polyketide synthase PksN
MDHFVSSGGREKEGWKCVGLSEMLFTDEEAERERQGRRKALKPEEITALFEWSLSLRETPLLWETIDDLPERIEKAYERKSEVLPGGAGMEAVMRSERPSLRNAYVAPKTRIEETLVGMLQDFFGIGKIGVTDDFFDLGGDSLKAMMLLNKIKKEFLVNITVKDLLESQNVRKMAAEIEEKLWMKDDGQKRFVSII